jgi:TRAP-type C4-dicarboxylate transport system permease small subunit
MRQGFTRFVLGGLGIVAVLVTLGMMAITFVDVIARYGFNAPLPGGSVITEILLVSLIFFGLPVVTYHNEHIAIDLLDRFVRPAMAPVQHVAIALFCALASALLCYLLWRKAQFTAGSGEVTPAFGIPVSFILYPMSVLTGAMAVAFVVSLFTRRAAASLSPD